MLNLRSLAFALVYLFVSLPTDSVAAEFMFPADQFGAIDLKPRQSTTKRNIETLGALVDRFELISDFRADDPIRQVGRPIGRLDILLQDATGRRGINNCTAAVIDDDKIITNFHCIPGTDGATPVSAKLRLGYLQLSTKESVAYEVAVKPIESNPSLDYSILRVSGNPAATFGKIKIELRRAQENEGLYLIHHPEGQPQRLTRSFCRAIPGRVVEDVTLRHRCDTLPGSSGALVFSQIDNALVGLHHSGGLAPDDMRSFNSATDAVALAQGSSVLVGISTQTLCPFLTTLFGMTPDRFSAIRKGHSKVGALKSLKICEVIDDTSDKFEIVFRCHEQFDREEPAGRTLNELIQDAGKCLGAEWIRAQVPLLAYANFVSLASPRKGITFKREDRYVWMIGWVAKAAK